ncbi:MAG: hypothetical protein EON55_00070 [Alphaproteobacteria bacterium]|nr:MAG: hypothetical protein EON55_00070 [Alphaproteobacteria bacterium]
MITGTQIAAARRLLEWEQDKLAKKAKLPVTVIKRAELSLSEPVITITQLDILLRTLKAAGIEFTAEEPSVKLQTEMQPQCRPLADPLSSSPRMEEGLASGSMRAKHWPSRNSQALVLVQVEPHSIGARYVGQDPDMANARYYAALVYFLDAFQSDGSGKRRQFVVVMPREEAVQAVQAVVGEGWDVTLTKRRVTMEQAAGMKLRIGRVVRELP